MRISDWSSDVCSSDLNLKLQLGYSHDVDFAIPEGIEIKTPDNTTVEISGNAKQQVGQVAAEIRRWRTPEPYKGTGIKYRGEFIFRTESKKKKAMAKHSTFERPRRRIRTDPKSKGTNR